MFRSVQDRFAAGVARDWLNQRIRRYGRVEALHLDSQARRISLEIQLEGEPAPISLEIPAYRLEVVDGRPQVTILEASASRPPVSRPRLGRDRALIRRHAGQKKTRQISGGSLGQAG
jgi:hypothetical protein